MNKSEKFALTGAAALAVLGLAACDTTSTGSQPVTVTQAPVTVTQAPATVTQAPTTVAQAPVTVPERAEITSAKTTSAAAAMVPMPDVVGMNLQAAQDHIQTLGVFFSRSEDATGAGRAQVLDSNWVVVAQTPEPGVLIGEGDALLYVKKIGE